MRDQNFWVKYPQEKPKMGKPILQFVDFIIAAENIEIYYRADRATAMPEETPAKILLSTCTALSKPNRT
jgi:hypothetical protein